MKSVYNALKQLDQQDYRVLNAIERGMIRFEYVPLEEVSKLSKIDVEKVSMITKKLNYLGLVQRWVGNYVGYVLTPKGYDCLALNALVKRGVLKSISATPIGRGKESDVYKGVTSAGKLVAVKFHRVGRISFRQSRRYRAYVGNRQHVSWLYQSRLAARNEFEALKILYEHRVAVPQPVDWNRHVVVSEYVEGVELSENPPLPDPLSFLEALLAEMGKAYAAGVVHADLSEYNVLVSQEKPIIFDWPQWLPSSHPSAMFYLKRDIENLLKFFKRRYRVTYEPSKAL
ncbi:MAG: serine/threonine-protein kinase RIO2, partial [Infirmifilum sp.]